MSKKLTTEEFIERARSVHGVKYDYSKVEYINKRTKVSIICKEHGEFKQFPADHLNGCSCPKCSQIKRNEKQSRTLSDFIKTALKIHGNKYDYSKVEYKNANTKVCIICPEHGEYLQRAADHLLGRGCPKCAKILASAQKTLTTEEFIERAKQVHDNKYDYSKVNYINNKTKVCIICPEHGEFWQEASSHLRGIGCLKCAGKIKFTDEEFIQKAIEIHGDKYGYSKVKYINNKTPIQIICPEHGEFWQLPQSHLKGCGCPKCAKNHLKNINEFIDLCIEQHGHKYDYSKTIYVNGNTKVCIICPEHGEIWETPNSILKKKYCCKKCKDKYYASPLKFTQSEFVKKAKEVHDNKYDYSKIEYKGSREKVCIICPEHGEFWQQPDSHLQGRGCPSCAKRLSNNENNIAFFIKNKLHINNIEQRNRTILEGKEIDIYLPEYKFAIEYNGLVWHSEKFNKDKKYHLNKTIECEKQNIILIHIFEDEWLHKQDIVLSKIKHLLKKDDDSPKVYARKCIIKEIDKNTSKEFLEKNHIQGFSASTVYLGCFDKTNEDLIAVMTFKKENNTENNHNWELTRFATDINKHCVGIGGKLFTYFIRNYNPEYIKSFADRRWTLDKDNNLYIKLGFTLEKILPPDYRYFYQKEYGFQRVHKFNFRKHTLMKKYPEAGLTEDMTEKEMCNRIGAYRVWDCGLFKYAWINKI